MKKVNFIERYIVEDNVCDGLVNYFERSTDYKKSDKNLSSVFTYPHNKNLWLKAYDDALTQSIKEYCIKYKIFNSSFGINQKLLSHFFPNSKDNKYFYGRNALTEAGNLICSRVLIYNTFLNDIEEGGEINFLWQKVKVKPKKGLTLLWPSEFTHAYTHLPAPKQNKYLISGFISYI